MITPTHLHFSLKWETVNAIIITGMMEIAIVYIMRHEYVIRNSYIVLYRGWNLKPWSYGFNTFISLASSVCRRCTRGIENTDFIRLKSPSVCVLNTIFSLRTCGFISMQTQVCYWLPTKSYRKQANSYAS